MPRAAERSRSAHRATTRSSSGVPIDGATASTYTLTDPDVGADITVVASYTDDDGTLENVTSAAWWHPAVRYAGEDVFGSTVKYNELFEAKYKKVPDYVQASASASGVILQLAIQKAKSVDPKKVRDALASLDAKTFYGPVKFGTDGQITSLDPPVFQIQGSKPVVILPTDIKQADLKPVN